LVDFAEYGLNYSLGGIAARRDYVQKNPDIVGKFIKAYVEGMHHYRTDREFTIEVQAEYSGITDRSVAEETYDLTQPGMPPIPHQISIEFAVTVLALLLFPGTFRTLVASNEALVEGAKREGEIVFYASMNLGEANILIAEFEKRYPFVKVKLNRTGSEKLLSKVLTEARAKKLFADVIQTVEFSMHIFNRSGVLARHTPQADALYPKNFKEEGYWTRSEERRVGKEC